MISRGKNKLVILTVLGIIFLLQVILYLILSTNIRWTELTLLILILLIAVIGVIYSLKALRKTEKRVISLPQSYQEIYLRADEIIALSGMKRNQKKETMNYILEIFEDASINTRDVNEVIGSNLEQFVQGFIEVSGGVETVPYLLSYSTFLYVIYLLFMKLYMVVKGSGPIEDILRNETLDLGIILMYAIISYIFFPLMYVMVRRSARKGWTGLKRGLVAVPLVIPILLVVIMMFVKNPQFRAFIDNPIHIFSSYFTVLLGILIVIISFILMKFLQNRAIKKVLK